MFSISGYETWCLIGQAREDNQHDDWDWNNKESHKVIRFFTITAEIHARSSANFYCQYADRQKNLKFMRRVSEREPAIRQFVIVKNKIDVSF